LIFGLENYKAVADAYITGLEQLALRGPSVRGGHPLRAVASVASFFVSRVDTAVDRELEKLGARDLLGKIGVANCKIAFAEYMRIFSSPRWNELSAQGARTQRVLWASTSTKNPAYPDTLYVDALIGPETVNTLPPETVKAFIDHGVAAQTLTRDLEGARRQIARLTELGIDFEAVTRRLQEEGVTAFAKPFRALLDSIATKIERLS
jgi:transaldolase